MKEVFNPEGKFVQYGGKIADLMWLNVLVMLCSLPIITGGAAVTAMHYVILKIYRNEEGKIMADFFKSFRGNFKQSAIVSVIFAAVIFLLYNNTVIAFASNMGMLPYALLVVLIVLVCVWNWSLIFLARYRNSVAGIIKIAVCAVFAHPIRSLIMAVMFVLPVAMLLVDIGNLIIVLMAGFTLPGFMQATLYNGVLKKLEKKE